MNRFFVNPADISGDTVRLSHEDIDHIRVLRLRPNETFCVCDGAGRDFICKLRPDSHSAEIVSSHESTGEPAVKCAVFAAFAKGDKLETVVQKSVELGAQSICIFPSARCVSTPDAKSAAKKSQRLQKIALEAAKQSGRGLVPVVCVFGSFSDAVSAAAESELSLFCYELENARGINGAIRSAGAVKTASVMTGPEGGFTLEEADFAASQGLLPVTLGPRILRCETAPIFALSAIILNFEDI